VARRALTRLERQITMNIAYWLRLVSLALYMTDPGRVAFDPTLVSE
jgi:hypothetical protein